MATCPYWPPVVKGHASLRLSSQCHKQSHLSKDVDTASRRLRGCSGGLQFSYSCHRYAATNPSQASSLTSSCLASGLYYLSELVEEHTVFTKKLLTRLIYAVIVLQILLCAVDKFPLALSALTVFSHVVYMWNLRRFPVVKLTDPVFILSCGTEQFHLDL